MESDGDGNAGPLSPASHERHLILCVRPEASKVVLGVSGGQLHGVTISRNGTGSEGDGDAIHLCYRLEPGDECCGVCHITHVHLAGGIDHCTCRQQQSISNFLK